jgi:hypothetical protein
MLDFWMAIGRWILVVLIGAMSFNPFAFVSESFSIDSITQVLESTIAQIDGSEEEITEVIDGPGPQNPDEGVLPPDEGPGEIGGPASEAPTPSVSPTATPTPTETATAEPTTTQIPTEVPAVTPRWDDPVLRWLPEIVKASGQTGVPMSLLAAEVMVHSGGYPALAGPGNRYGLAQVPLSGSGVSASALYDPQTNLNIEAARLAGFKLSTGTWNASILADLKSLCDSDCIEQRSTAIRAWRAYYNRVLANPAGYGFVMLPGSWQAPQFDVQVISEPLPIKYPPGTSPPTVTPTPSPMATSTPAETPAETPTLTPSPAESGTVTPTETPTATSTAPQAQSTTASPTPEPTETPKAKNKGNGQSSD